jgi:hypothetical protein
MVLVTDLSGKEPGKPGFLGALQDATTVLLDKLSAEDREEYAEAAARMVSAGPTSPHPIQVCLFTFSLAALNNVIIL